MLLLCLVWHLSVSRANTATNAVNGVWLGHSFVTTTSVVNTVPPVASLMVNNHVDYWFVHIGTLNAGGRLPIGENAKLKEFLGAVKSWEMSNGKTFKVFGWLSGTLDSTKANDLDLSAAGNSDSDRPAILDECKKLMFASATGSYVLGTTREFDGIQIDFEPSGASAPGNDTRFNNLKGLMSDLRSALGTGKLLSVAGHKFGTQNSSWWSPTSYRYMARYVDVLCGMTYDSGPTTATDYRNWMKAQTQDVLRAVSGKTWNNDASHLAPIGVQVILGFPAFPANTWHLPAAKNTTAAAQGTCNGLSALTTAGDSSINYFCGAAIYLYTNGTGSDGYSSESTDWVNFHQVWLGLL